METDLERDRTMMGNGIKTLDLFNFMELPSELRIQIYETLLIKEDTIDIPLKQLPDQSPVHHPPPHTSILKTCKKIHDEASPILYSKNVFTIFLANDSFLMINLFSKFRWSTIQSMPLLKFTSRQVPILGNQSSPYFSCSGAEITARFTAFDIRYSPRGPDKYMVLSIATWISTSVTRAELKAVQRDLQLIMAQEGDDDAPA